MTSKATAEGAIQFHKNCLSDAPLGESGSHVVRKPKPHVCSLANSPSLANLQAIAAQGPDLEWKVLGDPSP